MSIRAPLLWLSSLLLLVGGCGSSSTDPDTLEFGAVAGNYALTALTFDPRGVLPEMDIRSRIEPEHQPTLTLTAQGAAQLVFLDPNTELTRTVGGAFSASSTEVELTFAQNSDYPRFLLSRRMVFTYTVEPPTLTFQGPAPDGVSPGRLRELVPDWEEEQLLDPTPGALRVVFTRSEG